MNTLSGSRRVLLPLAAALLLATSGPAGASEACDLDRRVEAEVRLHTATAAGNREELLDLYLNLRVPGAVRGRALWALLKNIRPALPGPDRVRLLEALADPSPEVRRAALRSVGRLGERTLEREALKRTAEDPDPGVRAEALRAVRPWTRQSHLFFLEQAVGATWPEVRAEALANLARISWRELPPALLERVCALASPGSAEPSTVRLEALKALFAWGKLQEEDVRGVLEDPGAPEVLYLFALRALDAWPAWEQRDAILLGLLDQEAPIAVAWEAFRRLRGSASADPELAPGLVRYLSHTPDQNAATEQMAAFVRGRGYRIEYRSGAWAVMGQ